MRPSVPIAVACLATAACSGSTLATPAPGLHTLQGVEPPHLQVTHTAGRGVASGFVFLAEKGGKGKLGGPVIADNRGRIVWYHQLERPLEATDFRAQTYRGRPVLTWWEGRISKAGVGRGSYVIYDSSFRPLAELHAAHGLDGDLHEFQLTPRGTAYITAYKPVPTDLSAVGGPRDSWAYDSVIQELDIATGRVVFEWHSLDHVPLSESIQANHEPARHASKKRPFDYFHVNSVADAASGRILVSGRNTSAIYLVARDGHIVWRLGGKRSDFVPPRAVKFRFQHDARLHPGGVLTVFDNGAIPKVEPFTRPLVLKLDERQRKARIVKAFVHPLKVSSPYEGSLQLLPDGGAFVGWGGVRRVTEFAPDGSVRFELKLPFGDTYRGYREEWGGRPLDRPRAAIVGDRVYASWNGRTDIAHWDVLAGPDGDHLSQIAGHAWAGLETTIQLETAPKAVAVRARDTRGRVIGTSAIVGG